MPHLSSHLEAVELWVVTLSEACLCKRSIQSLILWQAARDNNITAYTNVMSIVGVPKIFREPIQVAARLVKASTGSAWLYGFLWRKFCRLPERH